MFYEAASMLTGRTREHGTLESCADVYEYIARHLRLRFGSR